MRLPMPSPTATALACALVPPLLGLALEGSRAEAHGQGLYKTKAEAELRAQQLGCQGTHQNNGLWMPCSDEAQLHHALRRQ